jgi:DNA-binding NarL/FixJ family response regulator
MHDRPTNKSINLPVKIILVDDDSVWRLGLTTALAASQNLPNPDLSATKPPIANFQVIAEVEQLSSLLERLFVKDAAGNLVGNLARDLVASSLTPKLLLLGSSGENFSQLLREFNQCRQQLRQDFPTLPVLLVTRLLTPAELEEVRGLGVKGYCVRSGSIETILEAINTVAQGQSFWSKTREIPADLEQNISQAQNNSLYSQAAIGVAKINQELQQIDSYLQQPQLSNLSWLFLTGRRRELRTARWVINQFFPVNTVVMANTPEAQGLISNQGLSQNPQGQLSPDLEITNQVINQSSKDGSNSAGSLVFVSGSNQQAISQTISQVIPRGVASKIYEDVQLHLESSLSNLTSKILEIDILSINKKRELLSLILQKFINLCQDLSLSEVDLNYITEHKSQLLQDLWTAVITDFFGKYASLKTATMEQEIVPTLLADQAIVQVEILEKIPFVEELLSQILFNTNLTIDDRTYPAASGEAIARAELILENLIIQVANAVIQPLLNQFSEVESIKLTFYDQQLISVRDITRFRNELSWRYRAFSYFYEPKLIFESTHQLYVFSETGIRSTSVYAPRTRELQALTGIRYFTTLGLELQDTIAPRLQTITKFLGKGLIYVLTQIIGRGLGLIGKGILQGIGNSFQEARVGRDRAK